MSAGTFYKTFNSSDRTTTRTLLHESIPITGTLVSGTYHPYNDTGPVARGQNIKTFAHGIFQSVYDYPFLSSSANHIFDIAVGYSSTSPLSGAASTQNAKKINLYNQMAQVLSGYDTNGNVRPFDADGTLSSGEKIKDAILVNFSRLLVKDEVKKGSFSMIIGTGSDPTLTSSFEQHTRAVTINDSGAETSYKVNSPAGEYGILKSNAVGTPNVGLLYYQAGIAVLTASIFQSSSDGLAHTRHNFNPLPAATTHTGLFVSMSAVGNIYDTMTGSTTDVAADSIRRRVANISFNNTTELNSTIYFCRANHNEFNYSSNPTYLTGSKIRVKNNNILAPPKAYVTTVGLYSADNELLAVAKLSEPLKKDPTNELTLRVRLDY